jgi:hypothetical protein
LDAVDTYAWWVDEGGFRLPNHRVLSIHQSILLRKSHWSAPRLFYKAVRRSLMVGLSRFELLTPRLSSVCSNQLSYRPSSPTYFLLHELVKEPDVGPILSKLDRRVSQTLAERLNAVPCCSSNSVSDRSSIMPHFRNGAEPLQQLRAISSRGRVRLSPSGSDQASLRHPETFAYGCFLPDLTGFTTLRCTGPNLQHLPKGRTQPGKASAGNSAPL